MGQQSTPGGKSGETSHNFEVCSSCALCAQTALFSCPALFFFNQGQAPWNQQNVHSALRCDARGRPFSLLSRRVCSTGLLLRRGPGSAATTTEQAAARFPGTSSVTAVEGGRRRRSKCKQNYYTIHHAIPLLSSSSVDGGVAVFVLYLSPPFLLRSIRLDELTSLRAAGSQFLCWPQQPSSSFVASSAAAGGAQQHAARSEREK